jgi:hypothetical protein
LVEKRSDEQDSVGLINQIRDGIVNAKVEAYRVGSTADATVTELWADEMPANSVGDFWYTAIGRTATASEVGAYVRRITVKRIGTAAVVVVGAGADVIGTDHEDTAAWDAAFALDAARPGYLLATVTGAAATSILWRARITGLVSPWE